MLVLLKLLLHVLGDLHGLEADALSHAFVHRRDSTESTPQSLWGGFIVKEGSALLFHRHLGAAAAAGSKGGEGCGHRGQSAYLIELRALDTDLSDRTKMSEDPMKIFCFNRSWELMRRTGRASEGGAGRWRCSAGAQGLRGLPDWMNTANRSN